MTEERTLRCHKQRSTAPRSLKEHKLIMKVKAGHFEHFQDLFAEVTSPYSEFLGIDPYPIWEAGREKST
jgi:hypothetical protein